MRGERFAVGAVGVMLAVLPLLVTACAAGEPAPPAIVLDSTACAHCGMLVSEIVHAAAFRTAEGEERVFDDIACMLQELPAVGASVWVHDFETGEWLDGERALYLRTDSISTPMGGGIVALSGREKAETYEGEFLTLDHLKGDRR